MPTKPAALTPPMTSTERSRKRRERLAKTQTAELRGVVLPVELHADAKRVIAEWMASLKLKG